MKKRITRLSKHHFYFNWLSVGLLVLLIALAFRMPSDPDMGWHLRNGMDLLKNLRFPIGDPYSWTMPTFNWVAHEWLTDIFMAGINNVVGLWGLTIVFAILIAGIFYFAAGIKKTDLPTRILVAIISLSVSWNIIGVRPQMITLFGLAIVLYLLFKFRDNSKTKLIYWLPVVFLTWANLHGGFAVGFFAIGTFVLGEWIRRILLGKAPRRCPEGLLSAPMFWKLFGLSIASILASLVNPSGWGVYRELYQTLSNSYVLDSISEWTNVSLFSTSSNNLLLLTILLLGLLTVNKWKTDLTKLVVTICFFILAMSSWRHVPLFAIATIPLLSEQIEPWISHSLRDLEKVLVTHIAIWVISGAVIVTFLQTAVPTIADEQIYASRFHLPYGAIEHLRQSAPPKRLLNEYNWGGYLVWKYPEAKVFIDGRMAIWQKGGINIFREFQTIYGIQPTEIRQKLDQWQIDTVLAYPNQKIIQVLREDGWKLVYYDNQSQLWKKQTPD